MLPLLKIRHKQIAHAIKGQTFRTFNPEAKVVRTPAGENL